MSSNLNHICSICGQKYNGCDTCDETKSYMPWRTIVDSVEHYKIFIIIKDYTNGYIDKDNAKNQLLNIDLSELETFVHGIKAKIDEIMLEEIKVLATTKTSSKRKYK